MALPAKVPIRDDHVAIVEHAGIVLSAGYLLDESSIVHEPGNAFRLIVRQPWPDVVEIGARNQTRNLALAIHHEEFDALRIERVQRLSIGGSERHG